MKDQLFHDILNKKKSGLQLIFKVVEVKSQLFSLYW